MTRTMEPARIREHVQSLRDKYDRLLKEAAEVKAELDGIAEIVMPADPVAPVGGITMAGDDDAEA